jgi:glutamyl-Q tRNA(Asp) synthetase
VGYVGRFAPSPTGALHIGSLSTAVASFLDARQANGEWLLRIDDIDPPREVSGAADSILRTLEAMQMHWDRSVLYQSSRLGAYRASAQRLLEQGLAYRCSCTRKTLRSTKVRGNRYPGLCRDKNLRGAGTSIRVRVDEAQDDTFADGLQGRLRGNVSTTLGDYIVFRRDGLPAYHLAVVLDDAYQGVTDVVRGCDLLDATFAHRHLQRLLGLPSPHYWHLPVLVNADGQKLSKRTGARAVDTDRPSELAVTCLRLLGLEPPETLKSASIATVWAWARNHWDVRSLKGRNSIEI